MKKVLLIIDRSVADFNKIIGNYNRMITNLNRQVQKVTNERVKNALRNQKRKFEEMKHAIRTQASVNHKDFILVFTNKHNLAMVNKLILNYEKMLKNAKIKVRLLYVKAKRQPQLLETTQQMNKLIADISHRLNKLKNVKKKIEMNDKNETKKTSSTK